MSTLKELLKKHCPDGVEYVPLWSVTIWDKKFNSVDKDKQKTTIKYKYYLADELKELIVENGDVKILTTNISNLFTLEKLVSNSLSYGEIVCIPWGGNPIVQYYKGKFITSDNRIATSIDVNKLDNKFLYYVLINKLDLISSFYRGAGIKHPDMSRVLDIIIPLPPIEVQKEIVRILDTFTKYQDLLNRELELRKKQYEYYRDKLLTFTEGTQSCGDEVEWKKLPEIADTFIGLVTTMTKNYSASGVPLIFNSSIKENKFVFNKRVYLNETFAKKNEQKRHKIGDIISVHTGDVGTSAIIDEKLDGSIGFATIVTRIKDNSKVYNKYICYFLNSRKAKSQISSLIKGDRDNLNLKDFNKIIVPIPPLEEQERIVKILDQFDTLCNDITRGLPAEIELRKKQYEYYRDKLLTFKEKKK
ncbi:restriction endonuclease subunit S [Brachyspira pilosicoli]|uniref:restriction endonuclease subunit S n=2 Tax=Brachyspira pilosicoli TaxID=52584 RepID=UPI0012F49E48|nr:restriction endonuclease subunit S [Brachyspira pilosicoli]